MVREAGAARVRAVMVRVRGAVTRVGVVGEVEKENQGVVATAMVADGGGRGLGAILPDVLNCLRRVFKECACKLVGELLR